MSCPVYYLRKHVDKDYYTKEIRAPLPGKYRIGNVFHNRPTFWRGFYWWDEHCSQRFVRAFWVRWENRWIIQLQNSLVFKKKKKKKR